MAKNNKRKGTRVEHKVRKLLKSVGYGVERATGSLGPFDLIACHRTGDRWIQVKCNRPPGPKERDAMAEWGERMHPANCAEYWVWKDRESKPKVYRWDWCDGWKRVAPPEGE